MSGGRSIAKRRKAIERACVALEGLDGQLWAAQGGELGPLLTLIDGLGERVGGARFAVLAEAVQRGESGGRAHDWLVEWAPSFRAGGAGRMVKVVDASRHERYAGLRAALLAGRAPVANAACVVEEYERIGHRLHPAAQVPVMEALVELAETGSCREIRRVRQELIARYGHAGELQRGQDRAREARALSQPFADGGGLFDYRLVVDEEARAVLEAAIGALSAPRPVQGVRDCRNSAQRRMDALLEVVRRGVASASGVPATAKATLLVTMSLEDLQARAGAATVLGSPAGGALLAPETVRRVACDGGVIPAVLGSRGQLVDLGRRVRLFTEAQLRALWLRDQGCSFPACSVPAAWADAHHLWHWADGGATDLANGALLCGRHHDLVHAKGFHGQVTDGGTVEWDLTPGAYDHWLRQRHAAAADAKAGHGHAGQDHEARGPAVPAERAYDVWGEPQTEAGAPPPPPWRP